MHNDSPLSPSQVWILAISTLEDFKMSASLDILPSRHSQNRWEAPPQGVFKINVDGATSEHGRNSNIGVIIRDCNGLVVAALSKYLPGKFAADRWKLWQWSRASCLLRSCNCLGSFWRVMQLLWSKL